MQVVNTVLQDLFNVRNQLFETKLKYLDYIRGITQHLGPISYYQEYASLRIYFGRQSGSTYWMCHKALDLLSTSNKNILIFTVTEDMRKSVRDNIELMIYMRNLHDCFKISNQRIGKNIESKTGFSFSTPEPFIDIYNLSRINKTEFPKDCCDYVFIDPYIVCEDSDMKMAMRKLNPKMFILV